MNINTLQKFLIPSLFLLSIIYPASLSLSTNSRWIVSPSGERFKLSCVNWVGHLHVMVPEGLNEQPLKDIARMVPFMGFNCVRLTWAIQMYTRFTNLTLEKSLTYWNLTSARDGVERNNPELLSLSIGDVQRAVIDELGANDVVVVLDNHVSEPIWCCDRNDGNGFFGDKYFDPSEWLKGLSIVAEKYKENPSVVGMSMRNELRGPREDVEQWYSYMQQGAETINKQNSDLLIIVSGLNYDTHLGYLKQKPFNVTFRNKVVFESHWYAFGDDEEMWKYRTNEYCGNKTKSFLANSGFLLTDPGGSFPLFLSEFGIDQRGGNEMQNRYLSCILAYMAGSDIDWALWAFQGNYIFRENEQNKEEFYGVLSSDWGSIRNRSMLQRLQLIQQVMLDKSRKAGVYNTMYHPHTGSCIHVDDDEEILYNSNCRSWAKWIYQDNRIKSSDGQKCLIARGIGLPVTLSGDCEGNQSMWKMISGSNLHIATSDKSGNLLCLDWDFPNSSKIVTKKCLCLDGAGRDVVWCEESPQRQWFKIVPANIN